MKMHIIDGEKHLQITYVTKDLNLEYINKNQTECKKTQNLTNRQNISRNISS